MEKEKLLQDAGGSQGIELPEPWKGEIEFDSGSDRRFMFSRQSSFHQSGLQSPMLVGSACRVFTRSDSNIISIPTRFYAQFSDENALKVQGRPSMKQERSSMEKKSLLLKVLHVIEVLKKGSKAMKRVMLMISLNIAYLTIELILGIFTGRVGLISDAFHLTFGCGLLTFSLFAMEVSRRKPDSVYTYGYKRVEVLAAFTNALFLLFMSFSLAVEALHAFMQDESEHKHYLIVSAVANLLVNLLGVWFFRSYARVNLVYRKAEDMNYHSVCLHLLADSIRSAGLILASWFLTLGVENAEVLCMGLVSAAVFMLALPLFKATAGTLLQMAPPDIPSSAFSKCWRQISALEDVSEISQARFWEFVPGHVVGSLSIQVKKGVDDHSLLQHVHGLYHDLGIQDLTIQTDSI